MNYIINHSTLLTGLVSFWEMQEASGTRYDAHGTNHLTANGTGGVGQAAGKVGWGADLERADNDYLTAVDSATFPHSGSGNDISSFMWVKFESLVSWETFIQHYLQSGNNRSWSFYLDGTVLHLELSNNGTATTSDANVTWSPSTATWYHIGFTYDVSAGEVKFYVNGSQQGTTQTGKDTSYYASTAKLQLGTFYDGSSDSGSFDGVIDQAGLWTKVLTSGEITDLYNSGDGMGYGICFDAITNLVDLGVGLSGSITTHTVTGDDRGLFVAIYTNNNPERTISTVKWNTTESLTQVSIGRASQTGGASRTENMSLFYLANPTLGNKNIDIVASGESTNGFYAIVLSLNGVNQTTPEDDSEKGNTTAGTSVSASPTPTSTVDYTWAVTGVRDDAGSVTDSTNYFVRSADNSLELGDSRFHLGTAGSETVSAGGTSGNIMLVTMLVRPVAATAAGGTTNYQQNSVASVNFVKNYKVAAY